MNSEGEIAKSSDQLAQNRVKTGYLEIFLITILVVSLFLGPITVLELIDPSGPYRLLTFIIFFVALEGALTTWWIPRSGRRGNAIGYRAAELLLIVVLLRLVTWVLVGNYPNTNDWQRYLLQPTLVFDTTFVIFVILVILAWERSGSFTSKLGRITLRQNEVDYYSSSPEDRNHSGFYSVVPKNRDLILQDYLREWLIGGIVLILFAALSTIDLTDAENISTGNLQIRNIGRLGLPPEILIALIVYFVGGLWLASHGRLNLLRARWLTSGMASDENVVSSWRKHALLILLILASLAAFLPIGSTFAISRIFWALVAFISIVIGTILTLLLYLTFTILSLFGQDAQPQQPQAVDISELFLQGDSVGSSSELPALITGFLFWVVIIVVVLLAAIMFLRGRGTAPNTGWIGRVLFGIIDWFSDIWRQVAKRTTALPSAIRLRFQRAHALTEQLGQPWRFIRLSALSTREKVFYYYLASLKRARHSKIGRRPAMTPREYAADLEEEWPEIYPDIQLLTKAFEKARYSKKTILSADILPVRLAFRRVRSMLRNKRNMPSD